MREIIDWSEAWAIIIPLIIFLFRKPQEGYLKPVLLYLIIALCINVGIDIIWKFNSSMPGFLKDNNFLYNIHSIARLFFFIWLFYLLDVPKSDRLKILIIASS